MVPDSFGCTEMNVVYVNEKPMKDIITLHTNQYFEKIDVKIKEVMLQNEIKVREKVNGFSLPKEWENTLMVSCFILCFLRKI